MIGLVICLQKRGVYTLMAILIGTGDLIQLTLNQTFLGQDIVNIFWYRLRAVEDPVYLSAVTGGFIDWVIPDLKVLQSNLLNIVDVKAIVYDGVGYPHYTEVIDETGSVGGAVGNSFDAFSVKMTVETRLTRAGSKRFAGVTEGVTDGNDIVAGIHGQLDSLASAISTEIPLKYTGTSAILGYGVPQIVRVNPSVPPVGWQKQDVIGAYAYKTVSSQVSRKAKLRA